MNISNPKTTVGGLPLATTWYVNTRFQGAKKYIDAVSAHLANYTDKQVAGATADAMEREELISSTLSTVTEQHDAEIISAFCRYMTGDTVDGVPSLFVNTYLPQGEEGALMVPREYGYAYLGSDKKIAKQLMPDFSLMDVTVANIIDVFNYLKDHSVLDSVDSETGVSIRTRAAEANKSDNYQDILVIVKEILAKYVMLKQKEAAEKDRLDIFSKGDVFIVTFDDPKKTFPETVKELTPELVKVFSQSYMAGGWMCSDEERTNQTIGADTIKINTSITFTKLSFNQGEVVSINNKVPSENGNVAINLAQVLLLDNHDEDGMPIGARLAHEIQQIRTVSSDSRAMTGISLTGLVDITAFDQRFVYNDRNNNAGYAYTTINEFANLNVKIYEVTQAITKALDDEIARAKADEATISAALTAEVDRSTAYDTYLSGVIGDEEVLGEDVSVTDALLALKQHTVEAATRAEQNFTKLSDDFNTDAYDVLDVYTLTIPSGAVNALVLPSGISVVAEPYSVKYDPIEGWEDLYDKSIYNYFGTAPSFKDADISEVVIDGVDGRILDIYVYDAEEDKYEKIDADITYRYAAAGNNDTKIVSQFAVLGEYDKNANIDKKIAAGSTVIDQIIVRYTKKHTFNPAAFAVKPLFK